MSERLAAGTPFSYVGADGKRVTASVVAADAKVLTLRGTAVDGRPVREFQTAWGDHWPVRVAEEKSFKEKKESARRWKNIPPTSTEDLPSASSCADGSRPASQEAGTATPSRYSYRAGGCSLNTMTDYREFLASKTLAHEATGRIVLEDGLHPSLFPFQRDLVKWSLAKGRAALFADTGLGKTRMQLEWARHSGGRTLILAPLAVAQQTVREAREIGMDLVYARKQSDAGEFTITNYEMLPHFDASAFEAVVLDESSILKSFEGKTRTELIRQFRKTPMRLCCTATPAPNDISEIANHAEFLGILSRVDLLATFFVHDDEGWRLKGHARQAFYQWLASWGMSLKRPSDLGYADDGYLLPQLQIIPHFVASDAAPADRLFVVGLKGIQDRAAMRKATLVDRVAATAELISQQPGEPWLVWCGLNDEGRELGKALPGSVVVEGADSPEAKADALLKFCSGEIKTLITKCSIAGFGLNFQHCARMAFVGLSDSYEQYYQAIRRCYRFGQKRPVEAHIILSEAEQDVHNNVLRKEREAERTGTELVKHLSEFEQAEIREARTRTNYIPSQPIRLPRWLMKA